MLVLDSIATEDKVILDATIQKYIEVYGIDPFRITAEVNRLIPVTGGKSLKGLSGYIQDNFL